MSPHFLQTDSPKGGIIDSCAHGSSHPPGALDGPLPILGQDGCCPMKVHGVIHLPSLLDLPRWLLSLLPILSQGAGSRPATPAWCPDRLIPLWMLTSPLGSVPEGLLFSAQLRKAPSPCLVQCHHVCISRKESAGWRSTDLPGNLRIHEPLTGLLYGIPEGRCIRSHTGSHFILTTLKGSASPTWRREHGGQQGGGRARCHRQGVSLGIALHLAISRDKFSSERPEGLDPSCPTFSWARACRCSHHNTPALSSLTVVSRPLAWQLTK